MQILLLALLVYACIGVVVAPYFLLYAVKRIDHVASLTPMRVRIVFLPGAIALWPVLAFRVRQARRTIGPVVSVDPR